MSSANKLSLSIDLPDWIDTAVDWQKKYSTDEDKISLAIELSLENVKRNSGGPFGSAIFNTETGALISVGVNRVMPCNNSALHGEMLAIMLAEKHCGSYTLQSKVDKYELFTSCEPCAMCLGAILWSGVARLVCAATADDAKAIGFDEGPVYAQSYEYLANAGVEVIKGLKVQEARAVLNLYAQSGGKIYNGNSCF